MVISNTPLKPIIHIIGLQAAGGYKSDLPISERTYQTIMRLFDGLHGMWSCDFTFEISLSQEKTFDAFMTYRNVTREGWSDLCAKLSV